MKMVAPGREPAHRPWAAEYWLDHCEGYGVESRRGHIGFVEEVVEDPETGEPCALLVRRRGGTFKLIEMAIANVTAIHPKAEEIFVEIDAAPRRSTRSRHGNRPQGRGS